MIQVYFGSLACLLWRGLYFLSKGVKELCFTGNTYYNALKELDACDIIKSSGRGEFIINPALAWKGDSKSREKILQAGCKITFEPDCTSSEFELNA